MRGEVGSILMLNGCPTVVESRDHTNKDAKMITALKEPREPFAHRIQQNYMLEVYFKKMSASNKSA